jgi:hypothetical protein
MRLSSGVPFFGYKAAVNMEVVYGAVFEISSLANTYLTVKNRVCTEASPCIIDTHNWAPRWGALGDILIMNLNNGKEIGYQKKNISDHVLLGGFEIAIM